MLYDKVILVTGGTGSFGRRFTETVFKNYKPKKLIIFSRDEFKQSEMAKQFSPSEYPIRYFLGDVRDKQRLDRAFSGVDYVVHAAALKQVPALEYNPTEAVRTNVIGAENIVNAAVDAGVKKVIAISTDKAVNPVNLYGATKLVAEKIFIAGNVYSDVTRFTVIRYGNVVGSRGSVMPLFLDFKKKGIKQFPITHDQMTRFWLSLDDGVNLALRAISEGTGGEIFVPRISSMRITDLAKAIDPECEFKIIGIRPGEKLHETLISEDESRETCLHNGAYIVLPQFSSGDEARKKYQNAQKMSAGFIYRSDINDQWITREDFQRIVAQMTEAQ